MLEAMLKEDGVELPKHMTKPQLMRFAYAADLLKVWTASLARHKRPDIAVFFAAQSASMQTLLVYTARMLQCLK